MKSILTVLLVLISVSSVQARVIPKDSIQEYFSKSMSIAIEHRVIIDETSLDLIFSANFDDADIASRICDELIGAAYDVGHASSYFALIDECGINSTICFGIDRLCTDLVRKINRMQRHLAIIKDPTFALQINKTIKFLRQFTKDVVDSIPDEQFQTLIRDGLDALEN